MGGTDVGVADDFDFSINMLFDEKFFNNTLFEEAFKPTNKQTTKR